MLYRGLLAPLDGAETPEYLRRRRLPMSFWSIVVAMGTFSGFFWRVPFEMLYRWYVLQRPIVVAHFVRWLPRSIVVARGGTHEGASQRCGFGGDGHDAILRSRKATFVKSREQIQSEGARTQRCRLDGHCAVLGPCQRRWVGTTVLGWSGCVKKEQGIHIRQWQVHVREA